MSQINTLGPVGFNPTGEYDNTHKYERLDVVYYEGSSYVALQESIGQLPTNTEYWDCIAVGYLRQNTYDSVADMKADDTLKDGMYAQTVGYYSANDGGEAKYRITEIESETDYQEELNNGLYAELLVDGKLNVKSVGLNDSDDCSEKLQQIINLNYKSLYFPAGTYHFSTGITTKEIQWELDNNAELIATSNMSNLISINPSGTSRVQNMFIKGGKFNGNSKANVCLKLNKSQYFRFDELFVTNFLTCGIEFDSGYSGGSFIKNCVLWGISDNATEIGIDLKTNGDCHVIDCGFKDCKTALNIRGGDIKVVGCHAWTNSETKYIGSKFADITGAGRISFDHCVIDTMQYGVYGGSNVIYTSLINTIFMNRSEYGANNVPILIYSETSFNNYSGVNLCGLLIAANTGKVKIISDSLLSQKDRIEYQSYSGIAKYQDAAGIEVLNNPENTNSYSYKISSASQLTKSSNFDTLTASLYQINTWTGSGGTNPPGTDFTGVLYNIVNTSTNNDKCNGFQMVLTSTGKIITRYKKANVWSAWSTFSSN